MVSGEAVYYCGTTWGGDEALAADPKNPENRLRAWGLDRVLSGDVITEQNIHALDVATWIVDQHPLKAVGTCGKKGRQDPGTCNDHFAVIFTFPNDVVVSFASKQYGTGYDDIGCRMFGPKGTIETPLLRPGVHPRREVVQGRASSATSTPTARSRTSPTSTPPSPRATAPTPRWPPACGAT